MIVRKYENPSSSDYCEFWVDKDCVLVQIVAGDSSLIAQLDHKDIEDLQNWFYEVKMEIAPKTEKNG